MSDKIRDAAGVILIIAAFQACLLPALNGNSPEAVRFRSGDRYPGGVNQIGTEQNGDVCVNTESVERLIGLPGIGDIYAALIIDERLENGPFYYAEDLEAVKGIGPRTLEKFRSLIDLSQAESGE